MIGRSIILLIFVLMTTAATLAQEQAAPSSPSRRNMIEMRALDAEIAPSWEVVLPTGDIEIQTEDSFGGMILGFNSSFNFIDNTMGAGVSFTYPVWLLLPGIRFYQDVDFENTVDVSLTGSLIELSETASYISRQRGIEMGIYLQPADWITFGPGLGIADRFEGDIESSQVLDNSIYLLPAVRMTIDTLSLADLEEKIYTGIEIEATSSWRFKGSFEEPVEWDLRSSFSVESGWENDLFLNTRFKFGIPLKVWEESASSFYSLGGAGSVHGYQPAAIPAFRYGMLNAELKLPAFSRSTPAGTAKETNFKTHRFRILLVADLLAAQDSQALDTPVGWYAGTGAGLSFLISGRGNRHFRTRAYISFPIGDDILPGFYLETSLFSLGGKI